MAFTLPAGPACRSGEQKFLKTLDGPLSRGYNFWFFLRR